MRGNPRLWAACAVGTLSLLALWGASRLKFDDKLRGVLASDDAEYAYLQTVFDDFGPDDNDCVFILRADDLFSNDALTTLRELVAALRKTEKVAAVQSLASVVAFDGFTPAPLLPELPASEAELARARARCVAHPLVAGQLLSSDASATPVIVRLAGNSLSALEMAPTIERLRDAARRATDGSAVEILLTGVPVVRVEIAETVSRDQLRYGPAGALVGLVLAIVLFRRPAAVFIIMFATFLGALWTLGAMGWAGENINALNNVISTLVLVIGFSDAVHLMYDFRAGRARGLAELPAATATLHHLAVPCLLTSLTTAIGFGSLGFASMRVIRRFGIAAAAGVALALIAVVATTTLLCGTRLGRYVDGSTRGIADANAREKLSSVADWIVRHARMITAVGILLTIVLTITALRIKPNSQLVESVPIHSESRRAVELGDRAFGGVLSIQVVVAWDESLTIDSPEVLAAIQSTQDVLERAPLVSYPASLLGLLDSLPAAMKGMPPSAALALVPSAIRNRFVRLDRRRALISAHVLDSGGAVYKPIFADIDRELAKLNTEHAGIRTRLTGTPVIAARNLIRMIRDLAISLASAALVIFMVITIALRSIRLGLISLLPNILPLALMAAVLVWLGRPLQIASVIIFSVALGLAVDDTIHFLSRFQRELRERACPHDAIRGTFSHIAPVLMTTTLVFLGGFGVVATSDIPPLRVFAGLACVAIGAALLGDLLLLPALLAVCYARRGQASRVRVRDRIGGSDLSRKK